MLARTCLLFAAIVLHLQTMASAFLPGVPLPGTFSSLGRNPLVIFKSGIVRKAETESTQLTMLFGNRQPAKNNNQQEPKLEPVPGMTLVTFQPGGTQIMARPGERLGDIANRAGYNVPYGCREGVCGTCEAKMKQSGGQVIDVRICKDVSPKTNMDCPDRERMWGELRGGKKSLEQLKGPPQEVTIVLQNPSVALKRQQTWEQVKDSVDQQSKDWLKPGFQPAQGGKKTGWFGR